MAVINFLPMNVDLTDQNKILSTDDYTYTGSSQLIQDGDEGWRLKFLSTGIFTPKKDLSIDAFLVGGGGGGASAAQICGGAGGGGGQCATVSTYSFIANTAYTITLGSGGAAGQTSSDSMSAFASGGQGGSTTIMAGNTLVGSADGGYGGTHYAYNSTPKGGDGGSGGAGGSGSGSFINYNGGSDGSNGGGTNPGTGSGATTREFGVSTGDLYCGGGGQGYHTSLGKFGNGGSGGGGNGNNSSGNSSTVNGSANTGGGGGGGSYTGSTYAISGRGGSGIVIIRNHRE